MSNSSARIAVIGAGLIGSSVAWRLAQAGSAVTLIDAGGFGGETSRAGAGMLSPGGEFEEPSRWLDLGIESMRQYPAFVEELAQESGLPIDFQQCGSLNFVEADRARKRAELQTAAGIRVEVHAGGLFYPDDGFVDPHHLLRALRAVCAARGVELREHQPVSEIEAGGWRAIVVACGAWSSQLRVTDRGKPVPVPMIEPVKGHLIGFDLAPGSLGPVRRRGHTYILQRSNGFTLAGSNEERVGFDREVNEAVCAQIQHDAAALWPELEGRRPCAKWNGFRPFSPDGPHIGRVAETGVWLACGHFRNGILLAPLTASKIARDLL